MSKRAVEQLKKEHRDPEDFENDAIVTMVSIKDLSGVTGGLMFGAAEKHVRDQYDGQTEILGSSLSGERDRGRPVIAVAHRPYGEEA